VPKTFTHFLARSLVLLEDELPRIYAEVARSVGDREVRCRVDEDEISVFGDGTRLRLARETRQPAVRVVAKRQVIVDVVLARTTLQDALWEDRIVLLGSLDDLVAFHDALMAYVGGAVRCPSFPELLDEYLKPQAAARRSAA
jgi:hypothetical protein